MMLGILADFLALRGHMYYRLDGSVSRVKRSIDNAEFNRAGSKVGVNLQSAATRGTHHRSLQRHPRVRAQLPTQCPATP